MFTNTHLFTEAFAPDADSSYVMVSKIWLADATACEMREFESFENVWEASFFDSESLDEIRRYTEAHEAISTEPMPGVKMLTWHICKDDARCDDANLVYTYTV